MVTSDVLVLLDVALLEKETNEAPFHDEGSTAPSSKIRFRQS